MAQTIPIENSAQIGVIIASAFSIFLAVLSVGLRLVAKKMSQRLDHSDYCVIVALFCNTALYTCCMLLVTHGGFSFHTAEILVRFGPDVAMFFFKGLVSFSLLWNATVCFSKLSVLLMYAAIIPIPSMIKWARWIGIAIILCNVANTVAGFLICRPFAKNWNFTLPGTCGSQLDFYFAMGAINIITDIILIALPMPYLFRLHLPLKKKLFTMGMLSVGMMTWVVTIYRQTLLPNADFTDMPYAGILIAILSSLEPSVAIALACLPLLRPLFRSRKATNASGYDYGSGNGSELYSGMNRRGTSRRPFEELNDDDNSSEVQLQPMKTVQSTKVSEFPDKNNEESNRPPNVQTIVAEEG